MLLLVFVCLISVILCSHLDETKPVLDDQQFGRYFLHIWFTFEGNTWKARRNRKFEGITIAQAKKFYLGLMQPNFTKGSVPAIKRDPVDDSSYTWYQDHSNCQQAVRNQEQCGSCWAFSGSEVLEARYCLKSGVKVRLSPQDFVSCDKSDHGCQGGYYDNLWSYATQQGIVTDQCFPYVSGGGSVPACPNRCKNSEQWSSSKHRVNGYSHISASSAQSEIKNGGPIQCGMAVYQDFMQYHSGVYQHQTGSLLGYHAIMMIGWGETQQGVQYWICQNSWGGSWGQRGLFFIKKGDSQIDSNLYAPH